MQFFPGSTWPVRPGTWIPPPPPWWTTPTGTGRAMWSVAGSVWRLRGGAMGVVVRVCSCCALFPFPFYFSGAIFCVFLHPSAAECVDYFYESQCPVLEGLDLISIAAKILVYVWQTQGQTTYLQKEKSNLTHSHLCSLPGHTAM